MHENWGGKGEPKIILKLVNVTTFSNNTKFSFIFHSTMHSMDIFAHTLVLSSVVIMIHVGKNFQIWLNCGNIKKTFTINSAPLNVPNLRKVVANGRFIPKVS